MLHSWPTVPVLRWAALLCVAAGCLHWSQCCLQCGITMKLPGDFLSEAPFGTFKQAVRMACVLVRSLLAPSVFLGGRVIPACVDWSAPPHFAALWESGGADLGLQFLVGTSLPGLGSSLWILSVKPVLINVSSICTACCLVLLSPWLPSLLPAVSERVTCYLKNIGNTSLSATDNKKLKKGLWLTKACCYLRIN